MKKFTFTKKHLFIIVAILLIGWTIYPIIFQVIHLYIWRPAPDPKPEDFVVIEDEPFKGFKPLPEEEVEIYYNSEGQKVVEVHKDGYKLVLDPALSVSTWELEKGIINVSQDVDSANYCTVAVIKSEAKTVDEIKERDLDYFNSSDYEFELINYSVDRIQNSSIEAYLATYENDTFGVQHSILIQGGNKVITLSQNGKRYPDCKLLDAVLNSFKFK